MEQTVVRPAARRRARPARRGWGCVSQALNLLSLFFTLLACFTAAVFALLFRDPSLLALLPEGGTYVAATEPRLIARYVTPTSSSGDVVFPTLPPEWTATVTATGTLTPLPSTPTPVPTGTPQAATRTPTITPTATRTRRPGGPTLTPTATSAVFKYALQNNAPTYLANFINSSGCNWWGIAGQAFDLNDHTVIGLTVHLEGAGLSLDALTGSQPAIGPGGYEIPLGNHPTATDGTYHIQLRSNTGAALSDNLEIQTFGDCSKNLILVNFKQNH
jgi:hypothetical protein